MIIAGDWVLTPGIKPLERGAVFINGSRIQDVGPRDRLVARYPEAIVREHPGCVIMPGLVNAHTHLALTALRGLVDPAIGFVPWIQDVAKAVRSLDRNDLATSAAAGAAECLLGGTTVVGDIVYGPESPAAAGDTGLGGLFFWEVLGVHPEELQHALGRVEFPSTPTEECPARNRCGISPHSPYTSGPGLLRATKHLADSLGVKLAIHAAESDAETQLMKSGEGPLAETARRLAHGFHEPGYSTIRYLDELGVLKDSIVVHCVHLQPGDAHLIAEKASGVVLCPRSNTALRNGRAPVRALLDARARIALGTDSAASNEDLDMFAEARALKQLVPDIGSSKLIAMITENGADVLGFHERFGRLAPGYNADVIAVHVGETGHPARAVIEKGCAEQVRTVVTGGVARVLAGVPTFPLLTSRHALERVTAKAASALTH